MLRKYLEININTIEIFFLHYHSEKEAKDKWKRRIQRINWNKLLIKFNDQNGCTEEYINDFMRLPYKHKLFFTCRHWPNENREYTIIRQFPKHNFIMASYEPFGKSKFIDITSIINQM